MRSRTVLAILGFAFLGTLAAPLPAEAQLKKLKKATKRAVEDESANQVERLVRNAVRCAFDDPICVERAEEEGKPVVYTDDKGNLITDDEGNPVTDREEAAEKAGSSRPGEGVWANYDFVPGENVLFVEDLSGDEVGDFPRKLTYVRGNMEVVEWEGRRLMRATDKSQFAIELPEPLPERYTLEFTFHDPTTEGGMSIYLDEDVGKNDYFGYEGLHFNFGSWRGSGIWGDGEPISTNPSDPVEDGVVSARIMADDAHVRAYLNERRIANHPQAEMPRTDRISFVMHASEKWPIYISDIRLAGGGRDLYDALEAEGRVATRGILFATNSGRIRPESTPTLKEIGRMLEEHSELRLRIEGHTDSDGEEAYNQELSERRAAAVKAFLVEAYDVDAARLETAGLGESQPVADNDTPEGKQQNRRVELVKIG